MTAPTTPSREAIENNCRIKRHDGGNKRHTYQANICQSCFGAALAEARREALEEAEAIVHGPCSCDRYYSNKAGFHRSDCRMHLSGELRALLAREKP